MSGAAPGRRRLFQIMVVAGLIERDGMLLIGQRKTGTRHGLKWEFPGGKVEKGESPRQALVRELREELSIEAVVGPEITRYEYCYPRRAAILLIFHRVSEFAGEPSNGVFEQIRWERPEKLPHYDFLDGDIDFVNRLANGHFNRSF
jgi:8-oxo-dGTP diphosphatase